MATKKELLAKIQEIGAPKPPSDLLKNEVEHYYRKAKRVTNFETQKLKTQKEPDYHPVWVDDNFDPIDHFDQFGWTVFQIPDFNPKTFRKEFFDWLEACSSDFDRNNPETWTNLPMNFHGIFKEGIGHEEFVWKIREKVYPIFTKLWGCDNLLSSFDGGCFLHGWKKRKTGWIHCDQPRCYKGFCTFQGIVNLADNGPEDGGLFLLEGSDRIFNQYLRKHPLTGHGGYQFKIDTEDPLIKKSCRGIKVCASAGDLIIWDSRVFHCNVSPVKQSTYRMCVYVSMEPSDECPEKDRQKRIQAFQNQRMTSHFCYGRSFSVCPAKMFDHGQNLPRPPKPEPIKLNSIRRQMIGYESERH